MTTLRVRSKQQISINMNDKLDTPERILNAFTHAYHRNMETHSVTHSTIEDGIRDRHEEKFGTEEYGDQPTEK